MLIASIRTNRSTPMVNVTLPKISTRSAPWRTRGESIAPQLTLAAVVVLALMLAVTLALVTALGA
jgi:hypothetical protein